jgi:type I restriction enzyme S subunit
MSLQFLYKQTEIGRIPEEWEVTRLGDISHQRNESVQPEQKRNDKFVGLEHLEKGETKIKAYGLASGVISSKFRFFPGDILYGKLRPYLDKAVIADFTGICSTDLVVIDQDKKKVHPNFLIYIIHSPNFISRAISTTSGTNHPRTSWNAIAKFKFPLPPLPEQKKIAEVLSSVDQAIEKVDEATEKTQRLKKGLMQELLTKGIGHKEFKDTEIGRIPKDWELRKLGEIGKLERGKFAYRPRNDPRFYGGKFPFIQTGDIGGANGVIKNYFQTLNEEGLKISKMFKKGTIVISIAGNIGDVGILDFDSCFPDSIVGIKGDSEKAKNLFLMYLLQKFKRELDSIAPRSTQKNINLGILEAFKLPLPSLSEQQKIAEILSGLDERLELLRNRKERLERTKKGLMNDLLSGKKRVQLEA